MPHPDSRKYRIQMEDLGGNIPEFTDFIDARFAHAQNGTCGGNIIKMGLNTYMQWIHCVGNWGEEHSMCKKQRWYVERMLHDVWLNKFDEQKALGHFDYTILYGAAPYKEFRPQYQPVKKVNPGAYEFWNDRNFEPLIDPTAGDWRKHAPILHDIFVKGKKPVWAEGEPKPEDDKKPAAAETKKK